MGAAPAIAIATTDPSADRCEMRRIDRPHPDIELGVARSGLDYLCRVPDRGIDADTGLILFIAGYGMPTCDSYARNLLSYLANEHNCVAASVDYFGADLWRSDKTRWVPHPAFFTSLKKHYGLEVTAPKGFDACLLADQLAATLGRLGVKALHPECLLLVVTPEYNSMGFLPALDNLQVAHRLLRDFALNRRRLFVLGTSYGGYVASLMLRYAPQTFRMVIDNSGFSSAEDDIWNVYGMTTRRYPGGFAIRTETIAAFSQNSKAPNYFTPANRLIRNLLHRPHACESSTRLYGYHSITDEIAPTEAKLGLREVYAGKVPYELEIIEQDKIDGRVFKDLSHGMRASLRGVFQRSYDKFQRDGGALADSTDFDRGTRSVFPCGRDDYVVQFSRDFGVRAELRAAASR
jgi:pimeloyl-ACP methyl ester carboxylesterase